MKIKLYDLLEDFKSPLPPFFKGGVRASVFSRRRLKFPPFERGIEGDLKNRLRNLTISLLFICLFIVSLSLIGCDVEEPFEVDNSVPVVNSNSFTAIDFPSADGDSWEYATTDGQTSYTAKISGTKNIGGNTVRILETDSTAPTDYIGAGYGFPVRYYYFTKDLGSYTEYAFDLWVEFLGESGDTYPQRYQPKHITWSFPLYEGKEWTVSRFYVEPYFTYTRKVVSASENVTTPAGTFTDVFHIQESVSAENQPGTSVIADYWLVKGKGIIKYNYVDPISTITVTYELRKFTKK
jgi:hypothetical protein